MGTEIGVKLAYPLASLLPNMYVFIRESIETENPYAEPYDFTGPCDVISPHSPFQIYQICYGQQLHFNIRNGA